MHAELNTYQNRRNGMRCSASVYNTFAPINGNRKESRMDCITTADGIAERLPRAD